MKTFKYIFIALAGSFMLVALLSSCKKSDVASTFPLTDNATIVFKGDPAADGAGWLLVTSNDSTYKPTNLSTQYQVNNLKVRVVYHKLTTRYYSGQALYPQNAGITQITIDNIAAQ